MCVFVYSLIGLGAHKALGQVGLTLAQIIKSDLRLCTYCFCVCERVYTRMGAFVCVYTFLRVFAVGSLFIGMQIVCP